ncbi:MAG TPA: hypothetical protein VKQ36_06725, partial [Ktedonobacterales bacterium]|nr:hypothetical protein [Ktedonobacterales bacterium]
MSIQSFIPQIWSGELLVALKKAHVYVALCNRDYEGEIKAMGDTVKINGIGDITVSNYTKDTDISTPQALTDAQAMLVISQAKYINFAVDDVDAAQQYPKVMQEAMDRAGYVLADQEDQYVAGLYTDAIAATGSSGSPVTPAAGIDSNTGTTMYDYLVHMNTVLTQQNVPKAGRWAVIAPWMTEMLLQSTRFTSFNTVDARQSILTGKLDATGGDISADYYIGRISNMDIYESNNAPHLSGTAGASGSVDVVLAGHSMGITFAEGVSKMEAYR